MISHLKNDLPFKNQKVHIEINEAVKTLLLEEFDIVYWSFVIEKLELKTFCNNIKQNINLSSFTDADFFKTYLLITALAAKKISSDIKEFKIVMDYFTYSSNKFQNIEFHQLINIYNNYINGDYYSHDHNFFCNEFQFNNRYSSLIKTKNIYCKADLDYTLQIDKILSYTISYAENRCPKNKEESYLDDDDEEKKESDVKKNKKEDSSKKAKKETKKKVEDAKKKTEKQTKAVALNATNVIQSVKAPKKTAKKIEKLEKFKNNKEVISITSSNVDKFKSISEIVNVKESMITTSTSAVVVNYGEPQEIVDPCESFHHCSLIHNP